MKNIFILIFILSCFLACNKEYKQGEQSLTRVSNLRLVSVEINGHKSNLILDSGAGTTILDTDFARSKDIHIFKVDSEFAGIGGTSNAYSTERFKMVLLGDTFNYSSKALNLSEVRYKFRESGYNIHGILGGDILSSKGCIIDYNINTLICNKL